jgi:hypothetical protein
LKPANRPTAGFLSELCAHLATFKASLRRRRAFGDVLQVEVAEDIHADVAAEQGRVGRLAYTAEQADLEAARLLKQAQQPTSEGGVLITPTEARPIFRHISSSAARDRQITEALA